MRVLFAVNNEKISESIVKKYQSDYKEIISAKNVYYFNAIIKELQRNKNYDRIVIGEDLEPYSNRNYEMIDKFLFDKLDNISDEASNNTEGDIPIILICTDRREKGEPILTKLFSIGLYSALIGQDRTIDNLCALINKPRSKKEAKVYYKIDTDDAEYRAESEDEVNEAEVQNIINHFKKLGRNENAYVTSFNNIASQYTPDQLRLIVGYLPLNVRATLEENCPEYQKLMMDKVGAQIKEKNQKSVTTKNITMSRNANSNIDLINNALQKPRMSNPVVIPSVVDTNNVKKALQPNNAQPAENIIQPQGVNNMEQAPGLANQMYGGIEQAPNMPEQPVQNMAPQMPQNNVMPEQNIQREMPQNDNYTNLESNEVIDKIEEMNNLDNEQIQKRGRGRPPKVKPVTMVPGDGEVVNKKGRGRPRKIVPQSEAINENSNPIVNELTQNLNNGGINLFGLEENTNEAPAENNNIPNGNVNTEAEDMSLFETAENEPVANNNEVDLFNLNDDAFPQSTDDIFGATETPGANQGVDMFATDSTTTSNEDNVNLFNIDNTQGNNPVSTPSSYPNSFAQNNQANYQNNYNYTNYNYSFFI